MKVLSCYSYKGGTGRTTATANIASAIAKQGKNVLLLDLDIESAGLHLLIVPDKLRDRMKNYKCIQDYFNAERPFDFPYKDMIIDIKELYKSEEDTIDLAESIEGNLYLLPSSEVWSSQEAVVSLEGPRGITLLKRLLYSKIAKDEELNIDYVIIDAANGFSELSSTIFLLSNALLVFFRWSYQHLTCTVELAALLQKILDKGLEDLELEDYQLIANCCPDYAGTRWNDKYSVLKDEINNQIKPIMYEIPESNEMKWKERVVVFQPNKFTNSISNKYIELASLIVEKYPVNSN